MTFNSYQRSTGKENKLNTFQDQELITDLDLNWVQFKWRNHDPSIGRFFNVDPLSDKYVYNSPYAFSENRVVRYIELEGLEKLDFMVANFEPHKNDGILLSGKKVVDRRGNVRNKNIYEANGVHHSQILESNVDLGTGEHTTPNLRDHPSGFAEEMFDMITSGDINNFNHNFNSSKTENGSNISGDIDGTEFNIDVTVTDDNLIFNTTIKGGDVDEGLVIKIGDYSFSIGHIKGNRDSDNVTTQKTTVPYTMDKNGNAKIPSGTQLDKLDDDKLTNTVNE